MNGEIIHTIERMSKMLELLLNDEQREEIRKFDIKYYDNKLKELNASLGKVEIK